jgi:hypothetical protein
MVGVTGSIPVAPTIQTSDARNARRFKDMTKPTDFARRRTFAIISHPDAG